jgi:bifunctional DNA-binding transcriptional regulator/antitoxin component of YhaV-PrlF toxin-antitoxin module
MRIAIDAVGRLVIPKAMRDELGIRGPTEIEATAIDGRVELSVPDTDARVEERAGLPLIVLDPEPAPLDAANVRSVLESVRR